MNVMSMKPKPKPIGFEEYDGYKVDYYKHYTDEEWQKVLKIVEENRKKIRERNK